MKAALAAGVLALAAIALLATASSTNIMMLREVDVVGRDYAFRIPSTLPAGLTIARSPAVSPLRLESMPL